MDPMGYINSHFHVISGVVLFFNAVDLVQQVSISGGRYVECRGSGTMTVNLFFQYQGPSVDWLLFLDEGRTLDDFWDDLWLQKKT